MCDQIKAQCQRELWNFCSSDIVYLLGIRLLYCPIFISITFLCIIIVKGRGTNSKRENIRNIIPVTQLCGQGRGTRKAFRLRRPDKEMDFSGILTQLEFHRLLGHLRSVFLFFFFFYSNLLSTKDGSFFRGNYVRWYA